jgi:hypothetical protein
MTSLFGNYAIKQSVGAGALAGKISFGEIGTSATSARPEPADATALSSSPSLKSSNPPSIEEQLFSSRAEAKILASRVAMYMKTEWRRKLYAQLDSLLDIDEWMEGETALAGDSFATFLRLMLLLRPAKRPGFGLSDAGNLLAMWGDGESRLSIECRTDDQVRFIASRPIRDERETAAIDTTLDRVPELAAAFGLERLYQIAPN